MPLQRVHAEDCCMTEPRELDSAIEHAAGRARGEQERLMEEPPDSPELVPRARAVHHLAEDIETLAADAAAEAEGGEAEGGAAGGDGGDSSSA